MKFLISFTAVVALRAGCLTVEGDRIVARDVAGLIPEFSNISPDAVIGLAPMPTVRRVMSGGELVRVGRRFGLSITAPVDVCFESPTEVLTSAKVLEQIQASVGIEGVQTELVEFSRYPVPVGVLSFPKSGLNVHPLLTGRSIVFWRGKVTYGGTRSFSVWARVRMSVMREMVVAAETIPAGTIVTEKQIRAEPVNQFPLDDRPLVSVTDVVGRVARTAIAAGQVVAAHSLVAQKEVIRGAEVSVVVKTDGAQLSLPARAQSSGAVGETVSLRNPANGRTFRGVVNGRNQVTVTAR